MTRPLDTRLDREEGRRTVAAAEHDSAAIRRRHIWRAEAGMGTVIRSALARASIDVAQVTRLCLAEEAEAALAALPDTPELQRADGALPAEAEAPDRARADALTPKILALAQGFANRPSPDFVNASFAELFAWSLAQQSAD